MIFISGVLFDYFNFLSFFSSIELSNFFIGSKTPLRTRFPGSKNGSKNGLSGTPKTGSRGGQKRPPEKASLGKLLTGESSDIHQKTGILNGARHRCFRPSPGAGPGGGQKTGPWGVEPLRSHFGELPEVDCVYMLLWVHILRIFLRNMALAWQTTFQLGPAIAPTFN